MTNKPVSHRYNPDTGKIEEMPVNMPQWDDTAHTEFEALNKWYIQELADIDERYARDMVDLEARKQEKIATITEAQALRQIAKPKRPRPPKDKPDGSRVGSNSYKR